MESNGNGNGKANGSNGHEQGRIEDALLLQTMHRTSPAADLALLHGLRSYVQEVVRQEVVVAVTQTGELLQNMIKYQVSKQLQDSGALEKMKEYLLEECGDDINEKAWNAGEEAARDVISNGDYVDTSDVESMIEQAVDTDDIAREAADQINTDEVASEAAREVRSELDDELEDMVQTLITQRFRGLFVEDPSCCECGEVKPAQLMYRKHEGKWWCTERCFRGAQETKLCR